MRRVTSTLVFAIISATLFAAGLIWYAGARNAHHGDVSSMVNSPPVQIGGPFALTDQDGTRRLDKTFRGKFMLVFFGYTYCPDVCPTTLAIMKTALDKLGSGAQEIVPIFISVDPKRDTPEKLKSYLSSFGPEFIGLTGSEQDVATAAKAYHVYYHANPTENGNYTVDHSGIIYLMGRDGALVSYYSLDTSPDLLAADLKKRVLMPEPTG